MLSAVIRSQGANTAKSPNSTYPARNRLARSWTPSPAGSRTLDAHSCQNAFRRPCDGFFRFSDGPRHADGLFSATVTQCTDGDTFVLDTGQRVRLAGVDTPEKGSKDTPPQYYAREAERFTCERTRKQRVKVIPLPGASRDRYQRLVAEIILPDGRSLNEQLLQQGMASFTRTRTSPASWYAA